MTINKLGLFFILFSYSLIAYSGQYTFNDVKLNMSASFAIDGQYLHHPSGLIGKAGGSVSDAVLLIDSEPSTNIPSTVHLAVGTLNEQDLFFPRAPFSPLSVGIHYAYLKKQLNSYFTMELGQLKNITMMESKINGLNNHILHSLLWSTKSPYYTGIRSYIQIPTFNSRFFFEFNAPEANNRRSLSGGFIIEKNQHSISASYTRAEELRSNITLLVKTKLSLLNVGIEANSFSLKNNTRSDNRANSIGIYLSTQISKYEFPIRFEYFKENNSFITGYGNGYSLTITPTYHYTPKNYLRIEAAYVSADGAPFRSGSQFVETQYALAFQTGILF